jgi:hypothetical protein
VIERDIEFDREIFSVARSTLVEETVEDIVAAEIETEATPAEDLLEVNAAEQILSRKSFYPGIAPSVIGGAFLSIREDRVRFRDLFELFFRAWVLMAMLSSN